MCYKDQSLLGCTAAFLIGCRPTFQRCMLPPSSGQWGSMHLWNVGWHSITNMAVHLRRLWALYSPPWELEISHTMCAACPVHLTVLDNNIWWRAQTMKVLNVTLHLCFVQIFSSTHCFKISSSSVLPLLWRTTISIIITNICMLLQAYLDYLGAHYLVCRLTMALPPPPLTIMSYKEFAHAREVTFFCH
jgi:hypothetical protein